MTDNLITVMLRLQQSLNEPKIIGKIETASLNLLLSGIIIVRLGSRFQKYVLVNPREIEEGQ